MDIQAYIESGVIESYVLGMADAQEAAEVEQLSRQHPEIRKAINDFELALEKAALANAMPPPAHIKEELFALLAADSVTSTPSIGAKTFSFARYMAAASVILLLGSASLNVYFYTQFRSTSTAYQALLIEKTSLLSENQSTQTKVLDLYGSMQMMSDPTVAKVSMAGVKGRENSLATVFWDTKSKDVYVLTNKLPEAPSDKQYQLWAIVDNKPVDAGMIGACP